MVTSDSTGGQPMIIDVDTGVDDAVALALAIARNANLIGVTTVAGNVSIDVATRNTLDVLAWLGRDDIPVHRGASRPLVASYQDAKHVHGGNGLGGMQLPVSTVPEALLPGPAFILQSAERYAGSLTLVTLGPLTNLAIAINVRPGIVHQISKVVVMGGAYFTPGNVTPNAEFNVYVDPDAALQVMNAEWSDLTLVGLDVTHRTVLSRELWEGIPLGSAGAAGLIRGVMERTFTERSMSGFFLHDPLAVAVAMDTDLVAGEPFAISVDNSGEFRGRTNPAVADGGPLVATSVDAPRFVTNMCRVLGLPVVDAGVGLENAE